MYTETLLESLIQGIYEAATGAVGWTGFLLSLATALGSGNPTLYFADPANRGGSIAISVGMDEQTKRSYNDYYAYRNVWIQGARSRNLLRPGIVRSSQTMCSRQALLRSEWYADFCKRIGFMKGLAATVLDEGPMTSNIAVLSDNRRPDYGEEDFALMRALMPHLQRGLKMHMHLAASQTRGHALEAVINGLSTPVLLVTADGKVLFANTAAQRLISASDGLVVEAGALRALLPNETKWLKTFMATAAQTSARQGRKSGGTLQVSRPYRRTPLEVLISPLPSRQDEWLVTLPAVAAIFVTDRSRVAVADASVLIRLHDLTATEAKVAVALSGGLTGKEICRELSISYNTLKTHRKRIYAKTRTSHQSDLVRLLAGALRFTGPDDLGNQA